MKEIDQCVGFFKGLVQAHCYYKDSWKWWKKVIAIILSIFFIYIIPGYLLASYLPNPLLEKTVVLTESINTSVSSILAESKQTNEFLLNCINNFSTDCLNDAGKQKFYYKSVELGYYKYYNGKFENAITQFDEAIEIFPDQDVLYLYKANSYCHLQEYDISVQILTNLSETTTDFRIEMSAKRLMIPCLNHLGNKTNNMSVFSKVINIYNEIAPFYDNYGTTIEKSEIYEQAGYAYHKLQDFQEAAKLFKKQIDLDPTNAKAWGNYAIELYYSDDINKSKEAAEKALELNPSLDIAKKVLEEITESIINSVTITNIQISNSTPS